MACPQVSIRAFVLVFTLCLFTSALKAETLSVALAETDYPPFYYADSHQQKIVGASVEICEALAQSLSYNLSYRRYPFTRLIKNLGAGDVDMACSLFNTRHRAPDIIYVSVPHAVEVVSLASLDAAKFPAPMSLDTLRTTRIGGVRGYYYGEAIEKQLISNMLLLQDDHHLLNTLNGGRLDLIIGNRPTLEYYAQKLQMAAPLKFHPEALYTGPVYIAFSRSHPHSERLAADFTETLVSFRETERYKAILSKYGVQAPKY